MSISVKNITKIYGEQKALDNVSFSIKTGEIVGFLGPNGAGKSTMMKILTGFIPQTEGEAEVCGFNVKTHSMDVRKKIGYLPEHNPLYLDMFVKEYLAFVAGLYGTPNANDRINEMISTVGLDVEQNKKIGQLSKGYRQRVGLAQALIHNPEVLILDEPTTGLDPNQLSEIRELIKEIGKEKTIMLSTHIMQEVEAICDRIIIINKGKIAADESAVNIKQKTSSKATVITIEFDKKIESTFFDTISNISEVKPLSINSWKIICKTNDDIRNELFKKAVDNDLTILTVQKEEQRLEDIFKDLTK